MEDELVDLVDMDMAAYVPHDYQWGVLLGVGCALVAVTIPFVYDHAQRKQPWQ
jgi:hypothetical protein